MLCSLIAAAYSSVSQGSGVNNAKQSPCHLCYGGVCGRHRNRKQDCNHINTSSVSVAINATETVNQIMGWGGAPVCGAWVGVGSALSSMTREEVTLELKCTC